MKVQIMSRKISATDCTLTVKLEGVAGYMQVSLPTHEVLTEESLKAAIKTSLDQMSLVLDRMALVDVLQFKEIELD